MTLTAKQIADSASFSAFTNAYVREVDSGVWHNQKDWQTKTGLHFFEEEDLVLELQLHNLDTSLAIVCSFRSSVGKHRFTRVFQQQRNQWTWQRLDSLSAILLLISNIFSKEKNTAPARDNRFTGPIKTHFYGASSNKMELIARVVASHQLMHDHIAQRIGDRRLDSHSFIDTEQSLLFGHWLHPTPKSRQGIHEWQHSHYSPELAAKFQLHFFAVDSRLVDQDSIAPSSASEIINEIALKEVNTDLQRQLSEYLTSGKLLLPIHPLQAQWLLHQADIKDLIAEGQIVDLGLLGPYFSPSSSVRTLYNDELDFMIKLSIPVKITNSLRVNKLHELAAGLLVARYLERCAFLKTQPDFKFIHDPAYITLKLANKKESGFEVILRENPFRSSTAIEEKTLSIAALVQDPINPGKRSKLCDIIHRLYKKEQSSLNRVSVAWYEKYWKTAIEPAIKIYDSTGLAIESHQQNALIELNQGYPTCFYYRDNQGFYLSNTLKSKILEVEPQLDQRPELFYDDEMICDRFAYYLIINQLFSVINRFALDGLISENTLLALTQKKLIELYPQLQSVGRNFVKALLEKKHIPCKGNLLTRVKDLDELQEENELAVYTQIKNPFRHLDDYSESDKHITKQHTYLESA